MDLETLRSEYKDAILELGIKRGASDFRVFGSVARGDADETSDLDLLIKLKKGKSLFDLVGLRADISDLVGCRVDLVMENAVHWYLKDRIFAEAVEL